MLNEIFGTISSCVCSSDEDRLNVEINKRKQKDIILKIANHEVNDYILKGYQIKKTYKKYTIVKKEKSFDKSFEDQIWLLFQTMGFSELNEGEFIVNLPGKDGKTRSKQLDVVAYSENEIIIVECKSSIEHNSRTIRSDLAEFVGHKKAIEKLVAMNVGKNVRVTVLFCLKNISISENDRSDAKGYGFKIWEDEDILYFQRISDIIGPSTKYQFFATILGDIPFPDDLSPIPSISGVMGEKQFYLFCINPKVLLKIAYVHHRFVHRHGENAYQRMLDKVKLEKIDEFITNGGFFANNIIINLTKKPDFMEEGCVRDARFGYLKLPNYYSSAWIIDGQHRLYGYSGNKSSETDLISVLAFRDMTDEEQGNLFVDINRNQKAVEANLLWDLYSEIFEHSTDPERIRLKTISDLVKKMNQNSASPLKSHIFIPSQNVKSNNTNITLQTLCSSIKRNRILADGMLFRSDWETTENFAFKRIVDYFSFLMDKMRDDWEKGELGFCRSNNGISCFIIILKEIIRFALFKDRYLIEDRNKWKIFLQNILNPAVEYLMSMSNEQRNNLRSRSSSEGQRLIIAKELAEKISERNPGFAPKLSESSHILKEENESEKSNVDIDRIELGLREFIYNKLLNNYGSKWYIQGIPDDVKNEINKKKEKEYAKYPYRKEELEEKPRAWLDFTDIFHLGRIITWDNNWVIFADIFGNQEETKRKIDEFQSYRNGIKHQREIDQLAIDTGKVSMAWLNKCMKIKKVKI